MRFGDSRQRLIGALCGMNGEVEPVVLRHPDGGRTGEPTFEVSPPA